MTTANLCGVFGVGLALSCSGPPSDPAPRLGQPKMPMASQGAATDVDHETDGNPAAIPLGFVGDSPGGAGVTPRTACAGITFEPERLPLDMYFLVDSSGSMAEPTATGTDKWDLVTGALVKFLNDPLNAQVNAGIGFFPQGVVPTPTCAAGQPGCLCIPVINVCFSNRGGSCDVADYTTPIVPFLLPPSPTRLIADIQARGFAGGTPTRAALEGTYKYLATWTSANPGRKVVAVLATDGEPTGCAGNTAADVAALAGAALSGPSHIQTFVIGVGGALANLNQVARAGGTTHAFLTDASSNLAGEFSAALDDIRASAGPCAFAIPDMSETEAGRLDPQLVNVLLTPSGASAPRLVAKTFGGSVTGCDEQGGWHYDDPAAPRRIELCDATCKAAVGARTEVQFGCETVVQNIR